MPVWESIPGEVCPFIDQEKNMSESRYMDHIPFCRLTPGAMKSSRRETAEQGEAVLPYTIGSAPQVRVPPCRLRGSSVTVPVCSVLNSCGSGKY